MSDYIDNYENQSDALFGVNEMGEFEPGPVLDFALSQNELLSDLFYQAVNEGDLEMAQTWGEYACELSGIDLDTLTYSTYADELENYSPYEGTDYNNSSDAMEIWEFQGDTNRCAQFSQMFIIEEFYGIDLDPNEFCAFAEANGWFSEQGGTTLDDMNKMLDYFGIPNEMSDGNTFDDLMDCLNDGGRVIVAVDSGEYWNGEGYWEDEFDPYGADHAIEVIGYDPETNCVIVNDSGNPDGCGCEIPFETFMDAWADSGNYMVECYDVQK